MIIDCVFTTTNHTISSFVVHSEHIIVRLCLFSRTSKRLNLERVGVVDEVLEEELTIVHRVVLLELVSDLFS